MCSVPYVPICTIMNRACSRCRLYGTVLYSAKTYPLEDIIEYRTHRNALRRYMVYIGTASTVEAQHSKSANEGDMR